MYGKILHGSSFGGLINYVNDPRKKASLVAASSGVNLSNNQTMADSFIMLAELSLRTKKPVAHFILAFSPHDTMRINNHMLERLVCDYLKRMGYADNQFVAFRHYDKEHPHVHIVVNRVNFKGKCTKDSHEKDKNIKVCKDLTRGYGLYMASGKEAVKEKRLRSMDVVRYQMMHCVIESLQMARTWKEFEQELAKVGVRLRFRYNTQTNGVEGISFSIAKEKVSAKMKHDVSYSGKQLDASLTLSHICERLGNPVAIIHEQARDMYEDARQDWYDSHNGFEVRNMDSVFPDFNSLFPWQSQAPMDEAPRMEGNGQSLGQSFWDSLPLIDDVVDAGSGAVHISLTVLGVVLFTPYQPAISAGGSGQSTSKIGWGDDDKYRKKWHNPDRRYGRGRR